MADYNTVPITSRAGPLVGIGDGTVMLVNADPNNTVWLGEDLGATSSEPITIPLGPGATIVVDGSKTVYGVCAPGQTATVYVVPGGLNFFQLVEIIVKTLLIEASAGNGLFVYSAVPPAKGNLIAEITAPGTTSDPAGNSIPSSGVFNVGRWDITGALKEHFGINNAGVVFIVGTDGVTRIKIDNGSSGVGPDVRFFNDFGAILLVIDPNAGGQFQYQDLGSASQGPLIGAQSSKATTDPVNAGSVGAGVTVIDPVFGDFMTVVGATIAMGIGVIFTRTANIQPVQAPSNAQRPYLQIDAPEQTTASHLQLQIGGASPDGTVPAGIIEGVVSGSGSLTRATKATHEIQGSLGLTGIATPAKPPAGDVIIFSDTNGILRLITGLAGDTNVYLISEAVSTLLADFSINLITDQALFSFPVGIGRYEVDVWLITSNATAANPADYDFSGPAATTPALVEYESTTTGTAVDGFFATNSYTSSFTGQGIGGNQRLRVHGIITFTAAGTLAFNGREHVNTVVTAFAGGTMKLKRIG